MIRLNQQGSFRVFIWRAILLVSVAAGSLWPAARADTYRVATSGSGGFNPGWAVINNSGVVAFYGERNSISGERFRGIYKGKTSLVTLMEDSIDHPPAAGQFQLIGSAQGGDTISMNNAGKVAFYGWKGAGSKPLIYVTTGPVAHANFAQTSDNSSPTPLTITDDGFLAYDRIVRSPAPGVTAYLASQIIGPLNNHHDFLRQDGTGYVRIELGIPQPAFPELAPVRTNLILGIPIGLPFAMNDHGAIVFYKSQNSGSDAVFGIYTYSGGAVSTVVEMRTFNGVTTSEFEFVNGVPAFAINNNNVVVFYGRSRTLKREGFFRGSSPLTDKIVAIGDIIDGFTINSLRAPSGALNQNRKWFNDVGQIVFFASGFDNLGLPRGGLYVTTGVQSPPEPASAVVRYNPPISPPSSSFGLASNWQPLNGDPARVPQRTTTLNDTALFDRPEIYTVDLGSQHADRLIVKNGNVTFNNGEITVDRLSFDEPSLLVDNARLTLAASVSSPGVLLNSNHALIGDTGAARVDVQTSADWTSVGSLRVGGPAEGILAIDSGGKVTSGEARLGGNGHGHADVGANGTWNTGDLAIGIDGGIGDLTIHNGGQVESEIAVIGQEPSLGNSALVTGADGATPSRWTTEFLFVGARGTGRLEVRDGAIVNSDILKVGTEPGVTGSLIVNGAGANQNKTEVVAQNLFVGTRSSFGELQIQQGGLVKINGEQAYLGSFGGRASVIVDGIDPITLAPSTLRVTNVNAALGIGEASSASITISGGGLIEVDPQTLTFIASGIPSEPTDVRIDGATSKLRAGELTLGTIGNEKAYVTLLGGTVEAGEAIIGANGVIRGFGTLAIDPAHRMLNGGLISPGLSPGTLTILGNYEQSFEGSLLIEFGGTNSTAHDRLIVTNQATLDGKITFRFINGFAPKTGQSIDFLTAPKVNGAFATIGMQNLAPGFQFNLETNAASMNITALNDAVFDPRLPGDVTVTIKNIGGITYAMCIVTTANSCETIEPDGAFTRTNNTFAQAFQGTRLIGGDCFAQTTVATNTLVLGTLSPGNYEFNVASAGQILSTVPFTVTTSAQTLLNSIRAADKSLQFQLNGLPSVRATVEASTDLSNWTELETDTFPASFTDFDAILFPQRFYRARILP